MAEEWKPIILSAKVFGHLSQGLYRTPAGAIKELVSNSFDADARLVKLHTGFPSFETFSCQDDGNGMSQDEFRRLMNRGIGSSYKRTPTALTTERGRPVIGRLGLGILSLAQICTRFDIVSHHKASKTGFRAIIKFPPYTRQEMDKIAKKAAASDDEEVHGGEFQLVEEIYDPEKRGLRVFTKYLREPFRKRMRSLSRYGNRLIFKHTGPYKTFDQFLDAIYNTKKPVKSLNLLSDYDQLIFGIALAAPLPLNEGRNLAVKLPPVAKRQAALKEFEFRVQLDNMELANPVVLPSDRAGHATKQCTLTDRKKDEFKLEDGPYKETVSFVQHKVEVKGTDEQFNLYELNYANPSVAGMPLEFRGYLFQQTGRLYPRDIQGVLIRLSNVAIGKYDNAMMTYPYAEGPRYAMISSELFVLRGFDDALNIDRDSFNELHPHYMRVQAFMHSLLHERIFPETWGEEKLRNKQRRERVAVESETRFVDSIRKSTGESVRTIQRVERSKSEQTPQRRSEAPVDFRSAKGQIEIDRSHPLLAPLFKRKKHAQLIEKLVVAFESANRESSPSKRRELFYQILTEVFSEE
jgi:Histidine kinase-, DNA gyrase B-, and HSP90-like ATPase